jgi:hypothetical protein
VGTVPYRDGGGRRPRSAWVYSGRGPGCDLHRQQLLRRHIDNPEQGDQRWGHARAHQRQRLQRELLHGRELRVHWEGGQGVGTVRRDRGRLLRRLRRAQHAGVRHGAVALRGLASVGVGHARREGGHRLLRGFGGGRRGRSPPRGRLRLLRCDGAACTPSHMYLCGGWSSQVKSYLPGEHEGSAQREPQGPTRVGGWAAGLPKSFLIMFARCLWVCGSGVGTVISDTYDTSFSPPSNSRPPPTCFLFLAPKALRT